MCVVAFLFFCEKGFVDVVSHLGDEHVAPVVVIFTHVNFEMFHVSRYKILVRFIPGNAAGLWIFPAKWELIMKAVLSDQTKSSPLCLPCSI